MLDLHPANILGRGVLSPALEAALLARGIVFAEMVPRANGRGWRLTTAKRPIDAAVAETLGDALARCNETSHKIDLPQTSGSVPV